VEQELLENHEAIVSSDSAQQLTAGAPTSSKPITIRKNKHLNNRIEQDHRRIKRRIRSMPGFKSLATAQIILGVIEMVQMMRKRQVRFAYNPNPSLAEQFAILAA
jgi:putative transposase